MTMIEELKAAVEAATPGKWQARRGDTFNPERIYGVVRVLTPEEHGCDPEDGERTEVIAEVYPTENDEGKGDASFIALAHNLMPQLLEAVEALEYLMAVCMEKDMEWIGMVTAARVGRIALEKLK